MDAERGDSGGEGSVSGVTSGQGGPRCGPSLIHFRRNHVSHLPHSRTPPIQSFVHSLLHSKFVEHLLGVRSRGKTASFQQQQHQKAK